MRILALDQSLTATAGVLLETNSPDQLVLGDQYLCRPKGRGIYRMMEIRTWLDLIIGKCKPCLLVRELHSMRQFGAAGALQGLAAIMDMLAYENDYFTSSNYAMIGPGTWKKFCTGKGNLKKDTAYLMKLNKFFEETDWLLTEPGFEVANDNIADAICLGITGYFARQLKLGEEIPTTKPTATALSKTIDQIFDYGSI